MPIDTSRTILSPMPGVVKSVTVAVGDQVPTPLKTVTGYMQGGDEEKRGS